MEDPLYSEDLISLDYVDSQLYLTANFRSIATFYLPAQFSPWKDEIYNILKEYYMETCTLFEVSSSLELEEDDEDSLKVSSLSPNNIKVEIKLEPGQGVEAKFVSGLYGSLVPAVKDSNKTKISLVGTVKEINMAMNSIVVNFANETLCDANIIVMDGLNPPVSIGLNNISKYFRVNKPPSLNQDPKKAVQKQINSADIQTGVYFTFAFAEDTFEDDFAEGLSYELRMAHNNTAFPSWLNLNGLTLKGTPPEDIFGRELEMILIAKNEFKQHGVPLKLHIKVSSVFWLKLLMKFSPYILTLIGLFVSANKILNILRKGHYKHPKEFNVGVGEEISPNVIFPISFIKEEQKQSQLILKHLVVRGKNFVNPSRQIIDKAEIISTIKETIQKMPLNVRKQITLDSSPIIDQIIINKFIWMQLGSEKEIKTRALFENLKPYLLEIIERDENSGGFIVKSKEIEKLEKENSNFAWKFSGGKFD